MNPAPYVSEKVLAGERGPSSCWPDEGIGGGAHRGGCGRVAAVVVSHDRIVIVGPRAATRRFQNLEWLFLNPSIIGAWVGHR